MKRGKKYQAAMEKIDRLKGYPLPEAVDILKGITTAKFDESVELAARLGVDPRRADQMVRGTVVLPHGTGKQVRVLVLTKGDKETEAKEAGADYVGSDEFIGKIKEGWLDFDTVIATPDMMSEVGKLGKILGPRGLMPNPKAGTVTFEVTKAVQDAKGGKIEFRVDKAGNIHCPVGRASFDRDQIVANTRALLAELLAHRPAAAKGTYFKNVTICSTMSPGIKIDVQSEIAAVR